MTNLLFSPRVQVVATACAGVRSRAATAPGTAGPAKVGQQGASTPVSLFLLWIPPAHIEVLACHAEYPCTVSLASLTEAIGQAYWGRMPQAKCQQATAGP